MPVSYLRESLADGIAYTSIVDEKFKTNLIRIRLITPLRMETVSDHAVALGVIGVSNREYPDLSALTARLRAVRCKYRRRHCKTGRSANSLCFRQRH